MKLAVFTLALEIFSLGLANPILVGGECSDGDICEREPGYGKYSNYGSYPPPTNGYGRYSSYGKYPREAEPEADTSTLEAREPGYGKYSNYGSYPPPATGYGRYSNYGRYPREADTEAE